VNDGRTRRQQTPSQTAGPYLHVGCAPARCGIPGFESSCLSTTLAGAAARGRRIEIRGQVLDGAGESLRDAMVELWQADADGVYPGRDARGLAADPEVAGWGRAVADFDTGAWRVETVKPGRTPFGDGRWMAPHVTFWISARGINFGLHTRMYFPDEPEANAKDPVLAVIAGPDRAATLIARQEAPDVYGFSIRLQGDRETVFFDS